MMPKRVKHRKSQRGKMKGNASRSNFVAFGEYGLQALESSWITARNIEAGRVATTQSWHWSESLTKCRLGADLLSEGIHCKRTA